MPSALIQLIQPQFPHSDVRASLITRDYQHNNSEQLLLLTTHMYIEGRVLWCLTIFGSLSNDLYNICLLICKKIYM